MARPERLGTRERLLAAAGAAFAAGGYRGAPLREIAERAGANLASANYYFGSKQKLYLEVARAEFERLEQRLAERGAAVAPEALDGLPRPALIELLRARIRITLEAILDPASVHGKLMQRELAEPSEALPVIVRRHIDPMRRSMDAILGRLAPQLDGEEVERCTRSVIGQIGFYLTHRPALLLLMGRRAYPPGFVAELADHVTEFSVGGIDRLVRKHRIQRAPKERS
ncbi:MAG TPA: CerR family C-terminal domain-containing protein [Myxococcota bacterium]|nr:CerR family C-terminal domain-containing protein [Myxococcota bacterium]